MKNQKSFFAGMVTMLLIVCLAGTAMATTGKITKELEYRNIKVTLDGKQLDLRDAQGNSVEPFMFDGTNYLPVRALAESLGLSVSWDGSTNTVVLTTGKSSSGSGLSTSTETTPSNVPSGWLKIDGASSSWLLNGAANGYVVYRNGEYWADPKYVNTGSNEVVVSEVDISGGKTPEQEYVDSINANTKTDILVGINALSDIKSQLTAQKLREALMNGSGYSDATVSDLDVLQHCMPSLPDNFMSNPVSGTYDGIRVVVQEGEILMYQDDLIAKGFID